MAEQLIRCVNSKTNKVVFFKESVITESWMKSSGFKPQEVSSETKNTVKEKSQSFVNNIDKILSPKQEKERATHFPTKPKPQKEDVKIQEVVDKKPDLSAEKVILPESLKESKNAD